MAAVTLSQTPRVRVPVVIVRTGYDAAATNRYNESHWLRADGRDADSIILQDLPTLRNRCRYEIRNNAYAKGITQTRANDLIGIGPWQQFQSDNPVLDKEIEDAFTAWSKSCDLSGRLTLAMILRQVCSLEQDASGDGFILLTTTSRPKMGLASLRLQTIESDRIATPWQRGGGIYDEKLKDGIELDEDGRPLKYYVLDRHPGASFVQSIGDYKEVPAEFMIHYYQQDRPGQTRGVPRFTPSLPLFAYLRRWTLATVQAAETAANISGTLETESMGTETEVEAMDEVEIARNAFLTLPAGTKMQQIKPEQPASTYKEFKGELLNEIARPGCMPYNVAAANSADYNYASGRMDWQIYHRSIRTERGDIEDTVLLKIIGAWYREQAILSNWPLVMPTRSTGWPGNEHVDPLKEANAQETRLRNLTTTLATEYAMAGRDWERELRQIKKEKDLMEELGLKMEEVLGPAGLKFSKQDEDDEER